MQSNATIQGTSKSSSGEPLLPADKAEVRERITGKKGICTRYRRIDVTEWYVEFSDGSAGWYKAHELDMTG